MMVGVCRLSIEKVQHHAYILFYDNGALGDLGRAICLRKVYAGVRRLWVLAGHLPEPVFDDAGGVTAHAQLQKQRAKSIVAAQERLASLCGQAPALVLHKGVVCPQVHGHGRAADGAMRNQLAGDPHILLLLQHLQDSGLVVVGLCVAGHTALPQAVVPLGVKEPLFVKARLLKAVVDVCCDDKIVLAPQQRQKRRSEP